MTDDGAVGNEQQAAHLGPRNGIGRLNERSLHAVIKEWLWRPGDRTEVEIDGCYIDLVRGRQLIEIQTTGFGSLRLKLARLLVDHPVLLVHPIPQERWIVTLAADGQTVLRRRKSPKRGRPIDLFDELVRIPELFLDPNLTLTVLMIQEEQVRCDDGRGSWRRKGISMVDRRLLDVIETIEFSMPNDLLSLLPSDLEGPFTNRSLAERAGIRVRLAQKVTYSLTRMDLLKVLGKRGRQLLYARKST